jgi:hypothetical protein
MTPSLTLPERPPSRIQTKTSSESARADGKDYTMTLQNDRLLMEEAHRRVAERLRDAELERFGRRPRRVARLAVVTAVGIALVLAAMGLWALLP